MYFYARHPFLMFADGSSISERLTALKPDAAAINLSCEPVVAEADLPIDARFNAG
jgi:hypothetical protein